MKLVAFFLAWLAILSFLRYLDADGIVFYQGIFSSIPIVIFYFVLDKTQGRFERSILLLLMIYSFNITIITTVDRAYSVRMLLWIKESPHGRTERDLERLFSEGFIAAGGVSGRLDEQMKSGTLVRGDDGALSLSPIGEVVTFSFLVVRRAFNLKS
jgi:hypothetical protein